jgi:GNAT superfamily N-acetyltransferase
VQPTAKHYKLRLSSIGERAIRKAAPMDIAIQPATDLDADACGRICYEGFRTVNERYGFLPTFPSVEVATQRVGGFIQHPSVFGVVAETGNGRIVGFNFLSERDPIRAVGPIVTDPTAQGHGIGRQLLEAVLERARGARGVRLLQDTFNVQSFSLYAALGFDAQEILVVRGATGRARAGLYGSANDLAGQSRGCRDGGGYAGASSSPKSKIQFNGVGGLRTYMSTGEASRGRA